jgi:pilus assembly protein Flp/PilA
MTGVQGVPLLHRAGLDRAVGRIGKVADTRCGRGSSSGDVVMKTLLKNLVKDDQGGEVIEYALIAGLIVVAAIAVISSVGTKVVAKWQSVDDEMGT